MTLRTVLRTIEHYKLFPANQTLIIGVSGGTDSLALLHIIVQLRVELDIQVHIATLNHGIRDQDSEADLEFVKQIAEQWRIPYTAAYADIPQLAEKEGIGIEDAARQARYQFLADVAQEQDSKYVAVAHHANDQAETILMHLIRGSGLKGLRGMGFSVPMPKHEHLTLIRPLLHISRIELEQYCIDNQLSPRHDATNDDINYQRNFIRHEIVPRLQVINPKVVTSLLRLGDIAEVEDDYLKSQLESVVMPHVRRELRRWTLNLDRFRTLHEALKRRYLLEAFDQLSLSMVVLEVTQVNRATSWVSQAQVGTEMDLGQGIRLRLGYTDIYMEYKSDPIDTANYRLISKDTYKELSAPSQMDLNGLQIQLSLNVPPNDEGVVFFALPRDLSIALRTRRDGERFHPLGMKGHSQKLKEWMINRKIPRQIRDQIPVISANDQIVALCIGDSWLIADLSQYIVKLNRAMYLILG